MREFSLAEASRRLGMTVAAPYRHFADRGHAALLLDGSFDDEADPVGSAADQAASATLARIQGRSALRR